MVGIPSGPSAVPSGISSPSTAAFITEPFEIELVAKSNKYGSSVVEGMDIANGLVPRSLSIPPIGWTSGVVIPSTIPTQPIFAISSA